jgi:hypothetical protein
MRITLLRIAKIMAILSVVLVVIVFEVRCGAPKSGGSGDNSALSALDNNADGGTVSIGKAPPSSFSLTSPVNGAGGVSSSATFQWTDSTGEDNYILEIDDDPAFPSPLLYSSDKISADTTSFTIPAGIISGSGTFYWKVVANNDVGTTLPLNGPFSFTIVPSQFKLLSPGNQATGIGLTPTLSWESSSGTVSFLIELSTSSDFGIIIYNNSSTDTGKTNIDIPTGLLTNNTTYYWNVTAINNDGKTKPSNGPFSFTTGQNSSGPNNNGPNNNGPNSTKPKTQ